MTPFQPREEFVRETMTAKIEQMLVDLDNPPLVDRIFPQGWRNAPDEKLTQLYDLCGRTYALRTRSTQEGDKG